jgi:hypothetical protein
LCPIDAVAETILPPCSALFLTPPVIASIAAAEPGQKHIVAIIGYQIL